MPELPWLPGGGYEDWYLVGGSADLDPLNEGAVSGPLAEPHAAVARGAGVMAAGLYRLREGEVALGDAPDATWFSKPSGTAYDSLYSSLAPLVRQSMTSLWRRQMVLGPTPEFCLVSPSPAELDAGMRPLPIGRVRVA